jgi:Holliday junction resolvase RusA-like endonuclease
MSALAAAEDYVTIRVFGSPAPQGSKSGFAIKKGGVYTGRVGMKESSKHVDPWRADVKAAALEVMGNGARPALDGPLRVEMIFTFTRPVGHYGTGRNAGQLRASAPQRPAGMPDLSKLARSTEDALTQAGVWADDSRVVEYARLAKVYADEDLDALALPGAVIRVSAVLP